MKNKPTASTTEEIEETMSTIRHMDKPAFKEKICSQLFGQFEGYVRSKGLTKGNEYETQVVNVFECSKKVMWIDEFNPNWQITVYINSIHMNVEFGVVKRKNGKVTQDVTHRNKLENLRYKISSCSSFELIDAHQQKFDALFEDFKKQFEILEKLKK